MSSRLFFASLLALALVSCGYMPEDTEISPAPAPEYSAKELTDYHWRLDRITDPLGHTDPTWSATQGQGVVPILDFQEDRVSVSGLCNVLSGSYSVNGSQIRISQMISTRRMCSDRLLMQQEDMIGKRLPTVSAWHVTRIEGQPEQPRLTLHFADNAQWVLTGTTTAEAQFGQAGETLFLEIASHTVPCSDPLIPNRQCLSVRTVEYDASGIKQGYGAWGPFYGHIEGYEHTAGQRDIVRVKRYTVSNPPADRSEHHYRLDMIVERSQESLPSQPWQAPR